MRSGTAVSHFSNKYSDFRVELFAEIQYEKFLRVGEMGENLFAECQA